jgi:hypothetical protein
MLVWSGYWFTVQSTTGTVQDTVWETLSTVQDTVGDVKDTLQVHAQVLARLNPLSWCGCPVAGLLAEPR